MTSRKKKGDKHDDKPKINYEEVIWKKSRNIKMNQARNTISFTEIHLSGCHLDQLNAIFQNYNFITTIDLSNNNIADFSHLSQMQSLLSLNLEQNNIKDMKPLTNEEGFLKLQTLNLSKNKITELLAIKAPKLIVLNLNENNIEKIETFEGHPKLKVLSLRKNKIASLLPLQKMENLKELYLVENKIRHLTGLEGLNSLITLNVRKNYIDIFEETLPVFENLQYLNIRENRIEKIEEVAKLNQYSTLKTLVFSFNPVVKLNSQSYLFEILQVFPKILRINKVNITNLIRQKSIDYHENKYKQQQIEKARLEAEEKARQEAEEQQ